MTHPPRSVVPWWVRLSAKVLLNPLPYRFRRVALFRHGAMEDATYAQGVFDKHRGFVGQLPPNPVMLEMGPGDSVGSAIFANAIGASHTFLVDAQAFATQDPAIYREMAGRAHQAGYPIPDLSNAHSLADVLFACKATYLTGGVQSLASIASNSVDFAWSNSVVQHVPREQISLMAAELRRILRENAAASHTIDFKDMLGGSLNHLRVPARLWESRLVRSSRVYTNRMRCSEILTAFHDAGFSIHVIRQKRWSTLPISRKEMRLPFREMTDDDLLTYHLDVVVRPRP